MEKYGNKSPLMKFVHKYTGYIIAGIIMSVAIPLYLNYDSNADFFERWTCPMVIQYHNGMATSGDNPPYKQLPPEQKERFDRILKSECS